MNIDEINFNIFIKSNNVITKSLTLSNDLKNIREIDLSDVTHRNFNQNVDSFL